MGTKLVIGMAVATVASGISCGILNSLGKNTEAQYMDMATKSGLAITAVTVFTKFIKALSILG